MSLFDAIVIVYVPRNIAGVRVFADPSCVIGRLPVIRSKLTLIELDAERRNSLPAQSKQAECSQIARQPVIETIEQWN